MKAPYMCVPRVDRIAAIAAADSGGGPAPPTAYTYVTNRTLSNNVFWFDASPYPRLIDIGTPGPANVVATLKAILHVNSTPVGTTTLCGNRGGAGGFNVQNRFVSGDYEARLFTEDDGGGNQISGFAGEAVLVGDVVVFTAAWDASGQRVYVNGANEIVDAFTSGYGQFNGNGGFVFGAAANRSGYFDGSTPSVNLSEGVDLIACSIRKGVALTAGQVASDFAATDPSNLHLAFADHAWRPDPTDATKMITDIGTADLTFNTTDPADPPAIGTVTP